MAIAALFSSITSAGHEIQLPQADGSVLELEQSVERLVTLSPHLAELVHAAGAGDSLVATVEYSNFPEAVTRVPRVGDAFRVDVERIVALRPDLVIAWASGNPAAALDQIRSMGLRVWSVEIRELAEIAETIDFIGRASGRPGQASARAQTLRDRHDALRKRYVNATETSYFYQVDEKPLFTINGEHLISKGLKTCGGRNIFGNEPGLAFQVAHESVVVADPDALIAPWQEGQNDPLDAWRNWSGMKAVRDGALYLLNADKISRATPRIFDSLELACKLLHDSRTKEVND